MKLSTGVREVLTPAMTHLRKLAAETVQLCREYNVEHARAAMLRGELSQGAYVARRLAYWERYER